LIRSKRRCWPATRSTVEAIPPEHSNTAADLAGGARTRTRRAAPLVIAFSGGRDSATLLDLAVRLRASACAASPNWWRYTSITACKKRLTTGSSSAPTSAGNSTLKTRRAARHRAPAGTRAEAAARAARYAALLEAADEHGAHLILTAHHLDDRIETFLIQWLRGAGPDGLRRDAGGARVRVGTHRAAVARRSRSDIEHYVALRGLPHVEDPSNADVRLLRNSIRRGVVPALETARPGMRKAAARSIDLVAEAAEVLREYGAADLDACARRCSGRHAVRRPVGAADAGAPGVGVAQLAD